MTGIIYLPTLPMTHTTHLPEGDMLHYLCFL